MVFGINYISLVAVALFIASAVVLCLGLWVFPSRYIRHVINVIKFFMVTEAGLLLILLWQAARLRL